jgi:hypothetical protein
MRVYFECVNYVYILVTTCVYVFMRVNKRLGLNWIFVVFNKTGWQKEFARNKQGQFPHLFNVILEDSGVSAN